MRTFILLIIILIPAFLYEACQAQYAYSLDLQFNENVGDRLAKGSAVYLFLEDQGKIVVSGSFTQYANTAKAITRLNSDGSPDLSFSINIPSMHSGATAVKHNDHYFFSVRCIMLDGTLRDTSFWYNKFYYLPYAGSPTKRERPISLDDTTLVYPGKNRLDIENPDIYQILIGLHENGEVDPNFPHFEAEPMFSSVSRVIKSIPGGGYYLTGRWNSVNGYESPDIIRLTEEFEIDTTFKSPFYSASISTVSVDNMGRAWFGPSNVYSETFQNEDIPLLRLNIDGSIDTTFAIPSVGHYSTEWFNTFNSVSTVVDDGSGYVIGGSFGSVNGEERICIAKLSESGELLPDFAEIDLMRGYGYIGSAGGDTSFIPPKVSHLEITQDGNLLAIGTFDDVGNNVCHNIMQYKPTPLKTRNYNDPFEMFTIHPNPTSNIIRVAYSAKVGFHPKQLNIYDISGSKTTQEPLSRASHNEIELNLHYLKSGLYILEILTEENQSSRKKLVIKNN